MLQSQSSMRQDNDTYLRSFHQFSISSFSVEVTDLRKSSRFDFLIPNPSLPVCVESSWPVVDVLRNVKIVFHFSSPSSFNCAILNWSVEANMLGDQWPTIFRSIWHPTLQVDCSEIISDCSFKICHSAVNFFKCLVYILHNFCVEIVRWVSSFQSVYHCEYFKLVKYPASFIIIWSLLKMMITLVFPYMWRERSNSIGSDIS